MFIQIMTNPHHSYNHPQLYIHNHKPSCNYIIQQHHHHDQEKGYKRADRICEPGHESRGD